MSCFFFTQFGEKSNFFSRLPFCDDPMEVDIYNILEGALFESTGNMILWAVCSMLEASRSEKAGKNWIAILFVKVARFNLLY